MNNKGYAVKELLVLCAVLGVFFAIGISRVSFAYEQADKEEELTEMKNNSLLTAAKAYVDMNKDLFTEAETYFYGSDLVSNHYILDIEEEGYNTVRFKVTYNSETDERTVEIA